MIQQETKIDDIVSIDDKRKGALLRALDNYARFPDADLVAGLKELREKKICQTEEELVFLSFLFGSISGSDIALKNLQAIGLFDNKGIDLAKVESLINKLDKNMDENIGKE